MARQTHAVIYVPGLGDHRIAGQRLALKLWRLQGLEPYLFQMRWASEEPFDNKLRRLLRLIDRLHQEGKLVSLVGASAGASAAINAYAARTDIINGVGLICGKINGAEAVSPYTYQRNPPFRTSMDAVPVSLAALDVAARSRIISLKPLADESVPPADTVIEGARGGTIPVAGHFFGIAYGLTLGSGRIIRFLKRQARKSS